MLSKEGGKKENLKRQIEANSSTYFTELELNSKGLKNTINKIVSEKSEIKIWPKGNKEKMETYYPIAVKDTPEENSIIVKSGAPLLKKIIISFLVGKNILIETKINSDQYFTSGVLNFSKKENQYYLRFNNKFYLYSLRKDFRLNVTPELKINFLIGDIKYECIDVSAGGTAIIIPNHAKNKFKENSVLKNCILELNGENYKIPKTVIKAIKNKSTKNFKKSSKNIVSFQFKDLDEKTDKSISQKIYQEIKLQILTTHNS